MNKLTYSNHDEFFDESYMMPIKSQQSTELQRRVLEIDSIIRNNKGHLLAINVEYNKPDVTRCTATYFSDAVILMNKNQVNTFLRILDEQGSLNIDIRAITSIVPVANFDIGPCHVD